MPQFSVSLDKLVQQLKMKTFYAPAELASCFINTPDINRPGLILTGYEDYFDRTRIQLLGKAEMGYLEHIGAEIRWKRLEQFFSNCPPAVVVTSSMEPFVEMLDFAKKYSVPLMGTAETTTDITNGLISILSVELAQRVTRHGVLVEVYGEGILILGESGVGKSETAVELLKRGHRLIADDAVELRRVSNRTIVGQAPDNIRYFIELRGIGIINVARIFGMGAVKTSEKIDLVVELEPWDKHKNYSRTGLENNTMDILGLKIPLTVIPVMPGRNLAIILEIAALNSRQKALGYNAAHQLFAQLGLQDDISESCDKTI